MLPRLTTPSPETLAFLSSLAADEAEFQADVLQARRYHDGDQFVALTERLREFLGGNTSDTSNDNKRLRINVTRIVTTAVTERLIVSGFDSNEQGVAQPILDETGEEKSDPTTGAPLTETVKPVAAWAWQVWQANRMDAKQKRVHEAACRDGESFVIVDWDNAEGRPRFTPHVRYIDQSIGTGSSADVGEGCKAFYRNDDPDQDLLYVTKRWTEVFLQDGKRTQRQRLTIYYPDRIEKYHGLMGAPQRAWDAAVKVGALGFEAQIDGTTIGTFEFSADAWAFLEAEIARGRLPWPIPWRDSAGLPLGVPVAHFISSAGMEAREAWPAQNAINYLAVLELTAADMTAFRILVAIGWEPKDADGNPLTISPGTWVGTTKVDGKVQDIPPADISGISNLIEGWILRAAMMTDTPISRFITTKQVSAEGTQKQQDGPLVNKVRTRQGELGNGYEDCMRIAARLANTFGTAGLDDTILFYTKWEPAEVRDESAELEQAAKKQLLRIPDETIWAELGYSQEKIAEWSAKAEARRQEEMALAAKQPVSPNGNSVPFGAKG